MNAADDISGDPKSPLLPLRDDQSHRPETQTSTSTLLTSLLAPGNFYILLGPLLSAAVCLFVKLDGPTTSRNMLAILAWVFAWWLTEAVPSPVTSLAPLFLFPLFGISSANSVAHSYMDDVIALVIGSFILALAVEHYNIHRRLALNILIALWMTRSITDDVPGWGALFNGKAGDGTASVMMATLLFIIPNKKQKGEKLMDWNKCKKLPWNIILLLGAGFAIADGVRSSGLADDLSSTLNFLEHAPYLAIAPTVCLISAIITEFISSNNATTTLVLPLLIEIAKTMHLHPLLLMVPGAIGAQFAFLLPTGTPSNTVGFATGHVDIRDMIKTGLPLKIAGIAALSLLMPTLGVYVFGATKEIQIGV